MPYEIHSLYEILECEPNREEIISALAERSCRVFEVIQPANALVPYHVHEEDEVIIMLEGQVKMNIEEDLIVIGLGDVLTIKAESIHSAMTMDEKPAKLLLAYGSI
ncbi:MAG: cupin domain-containing protein [Nitrospinota bacterium]